MLEREEREEKALGMTRAEQTSGSERGEAGKLASEPRSGWKRLFENGNEIPKWVRA